MSDISIRFFDLKEERFASIKAKNIMTPIVSNKVHLFTGWRDIQFEFLGKLCSKEI
jgi:hypothetical protein